MTKPSVATMVETHYEVDTTFIKVDNQMVVQVGKNIVEDVLIYGRPSVPIITKNLKTKLGFPKPKPTPYHLRMAN
jgi:hypothetical protein